MLKFIYLSLFLLINTCNSAKPNYAKSIFGAPGSDEVEHDYIDGIEIIQTGLTHPSPESIYGKGLSAASIEPSDYPWPGHELTGTCTWALLKEEAAAIKTRYSKTDLTQEGLYKHPAAAQNFYTTDEVLNNADRVKIKFYLQPNYKRHFLPAFIPPGEVATIEIPENLIDSLKIDLNHHFSSFNGNDPSDRQRLNDMTVSNLVLNHRVNTIGLPYGATVSFQYSGVDPVEVTVSGVILQPYFYYGMTSDEEWESDLSKRPGPIAFFDTGNVVFEVPSKFIRDTVRMNDVMYYWRSVIQIAQTTVRDRDGNNNPKFGRITYPLQIYFDRYVPNHSDQGNNFCRFEMETISEFFDYSTAINIDSRKNIREMNFHHNSNWARQAGNGESNCNALNTAIFAYLNLASSRRKFGSELNDWQGYTFAAQHFNNHDSYPLARYTMMIHCFGPHKFRQFLRVDTDDTLFPRDTYGNAGSEMLRASHVFKRDMRYHWNFHNVNDDTLNSGTESALDQLAKMNLKPFHPVTNWYAVGSVVDDDAFISARPYQIYPTEQEIDFVSTMVQREDTEKFGDFEFYNATFEKERESAWKEVSKGIYKVTPKKHLNEIEEVNVTYLDKTTNELHVVICQFNISNQVGRERLISNIPTTVNTFVDGYKYILNNPYATLAYRDVYHSKDIYSNECIGGFKKLMYIYDGMIKPEQSGTYVFSLAARSCQAAFYLSEEPLHDDPDLDEDKMINFQPDTQTNFNLANHSKPIILSSNKIYYFRHMSFTGYDTYTYIGYKVNDTGGFNTIPWRWLVYQIPNEEELFKTQFKPKFEKLYMADEWNGQTSIKAHPENWEVYKLPKGEVRYKSNNGEGEATTAITPLEAFTDDDPTTEYRVDWWPSSTAFPHIFEIDMKGMESFTFIKLGKTGNMNYYPMNSFLQISLAPYNYSNTDREYSSDNYSIDHEESIIWEGFFDNRATETIELDKEYKGRYIRFKFINNSLKWKDGNKGMTCISSIEIGLHLNNRKLYPLSNTKYVTRKNKWDETRYGCYYNGRGYTGYAANSAPTRDASNSANSILEIRIPKYKPQFGIVGDYYPTMGRAVVKIDGVQEGIIGEQSLDLISDTRKLKKASRSYKSLLFYKKDLDENKEHLMTIEVTEGSVTLAAILTHQMIVKWNTDDERYPTIMKTEFYENPPNITDWTTPAKGFDFENLIPNEYEMPEYEIATPTETVDITDTPTEVPPTDSPSEVPPTDTPTNAPPTDKPTDVPPTDPPGKETSEVQQPVVTDKPAGDTGGSSGNSNNNKKDDKLVGTTGIIGVAIAFIAIIALSSGVVVILYKKQTACFKDKGNSSQMSGPANMMETMNDDEEFDL